MYAYHASYSYPSEWVLFVEIGLALFVLATLLVPLFLASQQRQSQRKIWGWSRLRECSSSPRRAALLLGLGVLLLNLLYSVVMGFPIPAVSDELGHLLIADTFAEGRWVNPLPPSKELFAAEHVILDPGYISKYPPGPGFLLALGQVLGGHPGVGVAIGAGLLAGAALWGIAAFLPAPWPLIGALFVALRFSLGSYWGHSYWGGALAAAAAFLLYGAAQRLIRSPRVGPAVTLAVALIVLANCRPWEGLAVSLVVAVPITASLLRTQRWQWRTVLRHFLVPFSLTLALLALSVPYHNYRTTGDPFVFPVMHHLSLEGHDSVFTFVTPAAERGPGKSPVNFDAFDPRNVVPTYFSMLSRTLYFQLGLPLLVCYLLAFLGRPKAWVLWLTGSLLVCVLFLSFDSWGLIPHYTAPALPATIILAVAGLRALSLGLRAIAGRMLPSALLAVYALVCVIQLPAWRQDERDWTRRRHEIVGQLAAEPGRQILIVPDEFRSAVAYIYNSADWESAEVLMVRDIGPDTASVLGSTFPEHRVWVLTPEPSLSWPTPKPVRMESGSGRWP